MANLPDVVRRRIFHHLSLDDAKRGLDWRHGHFMPIGHFSKTKQEGDRDRLKFCLIYPEYVTKLNIDLNQVLFGEFQKLKNHNSYFYYYSSNQWRICTSPPRSPRYVTTPYSP